MSAVELFLIAIGLSMDAFAVSVCKGMGMKKIKFSAALTIALFFGGFQALMPFVGWILGTRFQKYIISFDHWVAFLMLLYIGVKMIKDSIGDSEKEILIAFKTDYHELFILAVATSIDALAVGITIAFLNIGIIFSSMIIGVVTFILSFFGVWIGSKFGNRFERKAKIIGGLILILIGLKVLLEHLNIIVF